MLGDWAIVGKDTAQRDEARDTGTMKVSQPSEEIVEYNKAVESLARVLRSLGRHAFKLDQLSEQEIEREFERWAMHVLVGASVTAEEVEKPAPVLRRDWPALTRFVNGHRQSEKTYVTRNLQDVRNVLWEFTNIVGHAMIEDQDTDQQVTNHLAHLRTATEHGSFQEVKLALFAVVEGIDTLINDRKIRHAVGTHRQREFFLGNVILYSNGGRRSLQIY